MRPRQQDPDLRVFCSAPSQGDRARNWLARPLYSLITARTSRMTLSQRQTAPYVALCGCALTIVFEESRYCGHSGRVCYVFWRQRIPWVLVRLRNGETLSLPWKWTNLPQSLSSRECEADEPTRPVPILSAGALHDLVCFLHRRRNRPGGEL